MTGTLSHLCAAMLFFIGSHFIMSSRPVRTPLLARLGEGGFKGLYSLIAAAGLYWVITAYGNAPEYMYWEPHTAFKHLSLSFMLVACIALVAAVMPRKPTEGPAGIFRITRHPMIWGIALWGFLHVLANGDLAALIFFGGFIFLALIGSHFVDRRKAHANGEKWQIYATKTSHIPFAALLTKRTKFVAGEIGWLPVFIGFVLYLVLLILHETLFGIAPMFWVSGLFD